MSMSRFRLPRTQPRQRPAPFPIGEFAKASFGKPADAERMVVFPELHLTLATPFVCGACDGARTDFAAQTRTTDHAFIPCRFCQGEGAILPGETVIVDLAATQLQTLGQLAIQSFGRVRSPWMGADNWRDTLYFCKQHAGISSATSLEGVLITETMCAVREAQMSLSNPYFRPFGIRSFTVREFRFETPLRWPSNWQRAPVSDLSWASLATLEAEEPR